MGTTVEDLVEVTTLNDTDLLHIRETVDNQDNKLSWANFKKLLFCSLPFTYNLTSANITHTLPPITGAPQIESVYWTNGGTYKLTLAVTDSETVGGETAGTWKGEGEGHILVESDGSNWQVREYEDSGKSTLGTETKGFIKYKNGIRKQWFIKTGLEFGNDGWAFIYTHTSSYSINTEYSRNIDYVADRSFDIHINGTITNQLFVYGHRSISGAGTLHELSGYVEDNWK